MAKKVYAAYNGEPTKLYDIFKYNNDGTIDKTIKAEGVWTCYIQYTPDEDVACCMPIIRGKSDTTHIKYLRSEGLHFSNKEWVEKHVGLRVQEHKA